MGNFFAKLFGGKSGAADASPAEEPVEYNGFEIIAAPIKEGGQYRTAGCIRKRDGEMLRETQFIRADNHTDRQAAIDHALQKAKQIINEQGEALLERKQV